MVRRHRRRARHHGPAQRSGYRLRFRADLLIVRSHDAAGLPLPDVEPIVTPVLGGGTVDNVLRAPGRSYPNSWRITMHLGPSGPHQFRIQIGDVPYIYSINAN